MEKFNRAERRFQAKRLKKARRYYWYSDLSNMTPKNLGRVLNTPCNCSCAACCNLRRNPYGKAYALTRQEHVHLINYKEGIMDCR